MHHFYRRKLAYAVNISERQIEEVFNLLDGDYERTARLFELRKQNFLSWVPGSRELCEEVLSMNGNDWFSLEDK